MKLIEQDKLVINHPATLKIIPEEADDLWLIYRVISSNDVISVDTSRKVQLSPGKPPVRVKFTAEMKVVAVEYTKDASVIRVKGKIITTTTHVMAGVFHVVEIELHKGFTWKKKLWDQNSIEMLKSGCNRADIGADIGVLLISQGSARLFMVGKTASKQINSFENGGNLSRFFKTVFDDLKKQVDFSVVKCMAIGGPGNTKDEFKRYLLSESKRLRLRSFEDNKSKIVLVNVNSISKEGLKQVLSSSTAMSLIKDTKSVMEVKAIKELNNLVMGDSNRACYGFKGVEIAQKMNAVETLLITDELFRSRDVLVMKKYQKLVDSVKKSGGKALIYSSGEGAGEELARLTGVAAILRFPLPDIEDLEL